MLSHPNDPLDPTGLETSTFPLVRRGFDPAAVRTRLKAVAVAVRDLQAELADVRSRALEPPEAPDDQLEPHRIAEALGVEATRVLESAHEAAKERAARAEREATAVREEALAAAATARTAADTEAEDTIERAKRDAAELVEEGRAHGRDLIAEAQTVRERMLGDLSRKRQTGRAQVEQLRAARDRLLESLSVVQENLDNAVTDLVQSVPEARGAAERAGVRIKSEPVPTAQQMEAELESARLVDHPFVADIVDPGPEPTFDTGEVESLAHLEVLEPVVDDRAVVDDRPEFFDVEAEQPGEVDVSPEPEPAGAGGRGRSRGSGRAATRAATRRCS